MCALRSEESGVRQAAEALVAELERRGIEVLYDDRQVSAGFMFSDADLLGVPVRAVVSPKNLAAGEVEIATRDKSVKKNVPSEAAVGEILAAVEYCRSQISE